MHTLLMSKIASKWLILVVSRAFIVVSALANATICLLVIWFHCKLVARISVIVLTGLQYMEHWIEYAYFLLLLFCSLSIWNGQFAIWTEWTYCTAISNNGQLSQVKLWFINSKHYVVVCFWVRDIAFLCVMHFVSTDNTYSQTVKDRLFVGEEMFVWKIDSVCSCLFVESSLFVAKLIEASENNRFYWTIRCVWINCIVDCTAHLRNKQHKRYRLCGKWLPFLDCFRFFFRTNRTFCASLWPYKSEGHE